jgi:hypothetical protein
MVNDYIAGNLGNAGVIAAFRRRAREGGSHHVRVNLSRCAMWLMGLGQVDEAELANPGPESGLGRPETIRPMTPYGDYERLAPLSSRGSRVQQDSRILLERLTLARASTAHPGSSRSTT